MFSLKITINRQIILHNFFFLFFLRKSVPEVVVHVSVAKAVSRQCQLPMLINNMINKKCCTCDQIYCTRDKRSRLIRPCTASDWLVMSVPPFYIHLILERLPKIGLFDLSKQAVHLMNTVLSFQASCWDYVALSHNLPKCYQ